MKRNLFIVISCLAANQVISQQQIKLEDIKQYVGDSVTLCTKVYGGIYLTNSKGSPTLLNAGDNYPNAPLTIVIWVEDRKKFKEQPEVFYNGKNICVTGKVILYRENQK